jgi:hypothetical protein
VGRIRTRAFADGSLLRDDLQWRIDDLKKRDTELADQIEEVDRESRIARAKRLRTEDVRALLESAKTYWPIGTIEDRRALAKALANAFGGLTVASDGHLTLGENTSATAQAANAC